MVRLLLYMPCRDRQARAEVAMQAFQANAQQFWAGKKQAQAFIAASSRARLRQKLQAWQRWAEKRCLLRDSLKIVSIARRQTTLAAGTGISLLCSPLPVPSMVLAQLSSAAGGTECMRECFASSLGLGVCLCQ